MCPFNKTAPPDPGRTRESAPLDMWSSMGLRELAEMDAETFDRVTPGSPLRRAGRAGIARDAVVVAANRVRAGAFGEDEVQCLRAGLAHDSAAVREVAAWGLAAIEGGTERARG
ncbi:MAG: hypothetical protein R3B70_08250 [Polyangiaceae bacterium]